MSIDLKNTQLGRVVKTEEPPDIKPVFKEEPKYVSGKLAVCHNCGYTSLDFNRCQRCKRKLPENCKSIPVCDSFKKKPVKEGGISPEKFFQKVNIKTEPSGEVPKGRARARPPSKRSRSKLVEEQPVVLTLSSDDEDNTNSDFDSSVTGDRSLSSRLSNDGFSDTLTETSSVMNKEPIITEEEDTGSDTDRQREAVRGGGRELESMDGIKDGSFNGSYTMLQCRTARIGSYRVVPKDRVILSSAGIRLTVPAIEDGTKTVVLTISILEIKKVLIHFGKGMPVLFVYVSSAAAAKIRSWLKMESKEGPYYDPSSSDETQKRITLLPERLTEDCKISLKSIFLENMMDELTIKEANELLVRASPKEINTMMKKAQGMSPLRMKDEIQTIMVYPPPPTKGGIAINTEDYACLGEDQFLNDVIIDFYLKYLTLSVLSKEDQARTHVFSTFFYKRLTTRPGKRRSNPIEDDPKLSPAEKRHRRVKGWTKHVNIFEKDFIIIPINEHCHWFLAIICFPGLTGPVKMVDNTPVILPKPKPRKPKKGVEQYLKVIGSTDSATLNVIAIAGIEDCLKGASLQIGSTTITPIKPTATITLDPCGEEGSDRDEAEGDDEEMEQGTSDDEDETSSSQSQAEANNEKHLLFSDVLPEEPQPRPPTPKQPKPEVLQQHRTRGGKIIREPIKQPCILIFDSLAGASRSRVVATLRDYLRIEYKVKEGKERDFSKDTIKGGTPKVPQQTNFTDCGIYVLQYAESFFKDPVKDYYLPMRTLANWFPEEVVNRKREEIKDLLVDLMEKQDIDVESLNLPKLVFTSSEEQQQQESITPGPDAAVHNSTPPFNSNTETVEGGLLIGCTEEDDYEEMETDDEVEVPARIIDTAEFKKKEISKIVVERKFNLQQNNLNSKVDSIISIGECNRSLVNYPDTDSDESGITNNAVQGNNTISTPPCSSSSEITPAKTNNTMKYLKAKRIERHSARKSEATSVKRLKTGNDALSNNDR